MAGNPVPMRARDIRALTCAIVSGRDPQIMRIVALVDAMMQRGRADLPIEPLRARLATLRPPPPLRFDRLMFRPLDLLVVPATRWRPGRQAIPCTAVVAMGEHVRLTMGEAAEAIGAEIEGHTTAEVEMISRLGRSLWPAAAAILAAGSAIPEAWEATQLGDIHYRPLADIVSTLLAEAAGIDLLHAKVATGVLPLEQETIEGMLGRTARANEAALPMLIAVLLDRLPQAAELLLKMQKNPEGSAIQAAMDDAAEVLLRALDQEDGTNASIAGGTLADAGAAVRRFAVLLKHLDGRNAKPRRRERLRALRQRLEADCKARFALGLQDELLAPLLHLGVAPAPAEILVLEVAARGLRVLEIEGRGVGSGSIYGMLLGMAAEAIKDPAMRDRLSPIEQRRLVEILVGPDAALAMLDEQS
jgi:hypothetical protein